MKKYQAAAYMRVSISDKRTLGSESIISQQAIIQNFVQQNDDIEIRSEFVDDGQSGLVFDRSAFIEMMDAVTVGKINCIIVKDLSRFGRDYIQTGRYLANILPSLGIRFIAITDMIDTDKKDINDDFVLQIKTLLNDEFSREISQRTRIVIKSMSESGLYVGASPVYGYKRCETEKHKLAIDEECASIVRRIFRMKIEGYTTSHIAKCLNDEGVLSPLQYKKKYDSDTKSNWTVSTLLRILKDETYVGALVQQKYTTISYKLKRIITKPKSQWCRISKAHEPIISMCDYNTVQRLIAMDIRVSPYKNQVGLFSGLLFCGSCGANMTIKTVKSTDKVYRYYFCPVSKEDGCNSSVYIKEYELEKLVFDEIRAYLNGVDKFLKRIANLDKASIVDLLCKNQKQDFEEKRQLLEQLFLLRSSLHQSLIVGIIEKEEFDEMRVGYDDKIAKAEDVVEKSVLEMNQVFDNLDGLLEELRNFGNYRGLDSFDRGKIVRMVNRITLEKRNAVDIEFVIDVV